MPFRNPTTIALVVVQLLALLACSKSEDPFQTDFDWEHGTPMEFIAFLKQSSAPFVTVPAIQDAWIRREHLPDLIALLDSRTPCPSVVSIESSYLPGRSTVGNEAAYLIVGYRAGRYPPTLSSDRPSPDCDEILQWWNSQGSE